MRILIATDGSVHSETAAHTLFALKPPSDSEFFIVHVKEPPDYMVTPIVPPPYHTEWLRVQQELQTEAEEAASQAVTAIERVLASEGVTAQSMIREGHPADEIVRAADEIEADLVVVGSRGLTGSMMFLLGSVSQKVVKYARCSVLLSKPAADAGRPSITKVLLATDGSENAEEAARFLSSFRLPDDVEITVLNVVRQQRRLSLSASARRVLEQARRMNIEKAEQVVRVTRDCLAPGVRAATAVREGEPAEEILKASSEIDADIIVVGSKGLSGIRLFLLGSVSQRICKYSERSVLLVKMRHAADCAPEGNPA